MSKYELRVGGQTDTDTHTQADTHINTMTRPGLRAGPSENVLCLKFKYFSTYTRIEQRFRGGESHWFAS